MAKNKDIEGKNYFSTVELAKLLGISRVAVFKKIKNGEIKAEKVGRNYIISKDEYRSIVGDLVSDKDRKQIDKAVGRVVDEYGDALDLLARE